MKKPKLLKLSELKHGMRVRCTIDGVDINDAKISIEDGHFYICQNYMDGATADDLLGYEYSWYIGEKGPNGEYIHSRVGIVSRLEKVGRGRPNKKVTSPKKLRTIRDVKVGEIIERFESSHKVLGILGELVFLSSSYDHSSYFTGFTFEELEKHSAVINGEPKVITKQQIAEKFGVDVSQLKIEE